jgi:hypothetical protein
VRQRRNSWRFASPLPEVMGTGASPASR